MIVNGVRIQSFTDLLKWYHTIKSKKCDVALPFLFVSIIPHLLSFIHQRLSPASLFMITLALVGLFLQAFPLNLSRLYSVQLLCSNSTVSASCCIAIGEGYDANMV